MVSNALEPRLIPCIILLVLGEISSQSLFIPGSLLPNQTVADFIQQQSIVIFLNQILQLVIFCGHFRSHIIKHSFLILQLSWRLTDGIQLHINDMLPDATCINEATDIIPHRVVWEEILLTHQLDDMISKFRQDRLGHLSHLHGEAGILESLYRLSSGNPWNISAFDGRAFIIWIFPCQFSKVTPFSQHLIQRIGCIFSLVLFGSGSFLTQSYQDMGRSYHPAGSKHSLLRIIINPMRFRFYVLIRKDERTNLLVTILQELSLERRQGIQTSIQGSLHL